MGDKNTSTIKDVAEFAGVSLSTVSRVTNNHPRVSAETAIKVRDGFWGQTLHYQLASIRIWNALYLKRVFEIWGDLKKRGQIQFTSHEFPTPFCDFSGYVAGEHQTEGRQRKEKSRYGDRRSQGEKEQEPIRPVTP